MEEVQQHIKQAGMEAIADVKGENIHIDFVENMLAVHKKYRDLIQVLLSYLSGVSKGGRKSNLELLGPFQNVHKPQISSQNQGHIHIDYDKEFTF